MKDLIKSVTVLLLATLLGWLFDSLGFSDTNIVTIYILGVLVVAAVTENRTCSFLASVMSVLVFNFLFTTPRFTFKFYNPSYSVTFLIMFLVALLSGSLAQRLKENERKSAEAVMLAKNEQLRANLLRAISHDLRTPLTSISGNASNLMSNYKKLDDDSRTQIFTDIYDDSMWLINLVENLLAVTRFEEGRVTLNQSTEIFDEVVAEALRHTARERSEHTIRTHSEQELILARVDVKLIVQVIINIVDNAIKYTPAGSVIDIHTGIKNGMVEVAISDNGPGIADEQKQHVFDMFYSGANKIGDSRRSLGLGLALCKSIVTAHGGTITVSDNKPCGACFTFTLPAGEVELHE